MSPSRVESIGEQLVEHRVRIENLEEASKSTNSKLDWIIGIVITTLIASVGTLGTMVLSSVKR